LRRIAVTVLVLALLGGTAAAFAVTEALKLDGQAISNPRVTEAFAPDGRCGPRQARFAFKLHRSDPVDAVVVDANGDPVRTLGTGVTRRRGWVKLRWGGAQDGGTRAPEGAYRLRVRLTREDRTITIPKVVRLESARSGAARCRGGRA
jgi:flagellar hook assembly protein FlgD